MDMTTEDKAANKAKEIKGRVKKVVGEATNDQDLKAKGRADQAKGDLKQAGEKVKDAIKK
jgi:uncharacterized protein YjbJ (UPF0337 family)